MADTYQAHPVEAILWTGSNWHEMLEWIKWENGHDVFADGDHLILGELHVEPGEYVVRFSSGLWGASPAAEFDDHYQKLEKPA